MSKILVVDDEKSIRDALCDILTEENYEVVSAEDGDAGFSKLTSEKIDLVLCDIKMPKMDGMELLQKVAEEGIDDSFHHDLGAWYHRYSRRSNQEGSLRLYSETARP